MPDIPQPPAAAPVADGRSAAIEALARRPVRSAPAADEVVDELGGPVAGPGEPDAALVTAIVVAHDGARWLPDCLAGLAAQTRAPQRVVGVDTGSTDGSAALLAEQLGESAVVRLPRDTTFG